MIDLKRVYNGRGVIVTGDTGFKGGWLAHALRQLGAYTFGYSLPDRDVRSLVTLRGFLAGAQPDFIFHLAAQAFVPVGYRDPATTFETNAQGTVNLLEALRLLDRPCSVVVVTTDKVYGEGGPFTEESPLRPRCPYSASKVSAEHAVAAYRAVLPSAIHIATARAGNVLGGGDFGEGRFIPNAVAALGRDEPIPVYNPSSVRPWQYVEDVIDGYLRLGAALDAGGRDLPYLDTFNFGPTTHHTTHEIAEAVIRCWGSGTWKVKKVELHEACELRIDSSKAERLLGWRRRWNFERAVTATIEWYKAAWNVWSARIMAKRVGQ